MEQYQREADILLQHLNIFQPTTAQCIDQLVELGMKRMRAVHVSEEERYVEQMLLANPITVERRPCSTPRGSNSLARHHDKASPNSTCATATASASTTGTPTTSRNAQLAESCRRSRINGKTKKAKLRYRHDFVRGQKEQSDKILMGLRDDIERLEDRLVHCGYERDVLLKLRRILGIH